MKILESRLKSKNKFQKCMVRNFMALLNEKYDNVLDVGCGKGFWSYVGAKESRFKKVFGCDIFDDYQVGEINPFVEEIGYRKIENDTLPFKNDFFDLVFSMDVIEHIENDVKFIQETLRVCQPGGTVIIGTPNYFRIANLILMFLRKLKYPRKMGVDCYGEVIHLREYRRKDLERLVKRLEENEEIENGLITDCWYGFMPLNIGFDKLPKIFENFCQFWYVKFNKK